MNFPEILTVPEICSKNGITDAIIAPGSRNAPLTISFARHNDINCKVIPDERSAAFIALGIAQQTNRPVVLICTSGSAALNFAPAIAEAYFQQIPLLILTADRPPEWIDQLDGQTIRQNNIYGNHVKKSFTIEVDLSHEDAKWYAQRQLNEGINLSKAFPPGPVHLNYPFREPLYPIQEYETPDVKIIENVTGISKLSESQIIRIKEDLRTFERKLIICGQDVRSSEELAALKQISEELKIPVVGDIISNIHGNESSITHSDIFLGSKKSGLQQSLKTDLLITFGKSILSKNLKQFLRNNPPKEHWHIQKAGYAADTYKGLTKVIYSEELDFLNILLESKEKEDFNFQKQENYYHIWVIEERKAKRLINSFFPQEFPSEFSLVHNAISSLKNANLHLSNSMTVRYANFIGLNENQDNVTVYCNRGTSGIDGCTSTAIGASLSSEKLNILISGDMAFLYDRNAFWHNYKYLNFRAIVLNNHGGGIFRMINGPSSTPELEEYFETSQSKTTKNLCEEYGIEYLFCDNKRKVKNLLQRLFENDGIPKILEIESKSSDNKQILDDFKAAFDNLK